MRTLGVRENAERAGDAYLERAGLEPASRIGLRERCATMHQTA